MQIYSDKSLFMTFFVNMRNFNINNLFMSNIFTFSLFLYLSLSIYHRITRRIIIFFYPHKISLLIFSLTLFMVMFFTSCQHHTKRDNAIKIVKEWTGKEIKFPDNVPCYMSGKDTLSELCIASFQKEYKILLYVDSTGCSSCRLKLLDWKQLIEEADSLFPGKVGFLLYFQPKSVKEMNYIFKQHHFDFPVFLDTNDAINRLNQFPKPFQYQCFLLDGNNKVRAIGNPVANMRIWDLYKNEITKGETTESKIITSILIDKNEHDFGTIRKGSINSASFTITNIGKNPLVINRVSTSCGCTNATWDKQPIESGKTTEIRIELTPDEADSLRKTITIYSNAIESPMKLTLLGAIKE